MITYISEGELAVELVGGHGSSFGMAAAACASEYDRTYGDLALAGSLDDGSAGLMRVTDLGLALMGTLFDAIVADPAGARCVSDESPVADPIGRDIVRCIGRDGRERVPRPSCLLLANLLPRLTLDGRIKEADLTASPGPLLASRRLHRWRLATSDEGEGELDVPVAVRELEETGFLRREGDELVVVAWEAMGGSVGRCMGLVGGEL